MRKKIPAKCKAQDNNSEVIHQVAYEHMTHIHIEWGDASADHTGFDSSPPDEGRGPGLLNAAGLPALRFGPAIRSVRLLRRAQRGEVGAPDTRWK